MGFCGAAVSVDWQAWATLTTGILAVGAAVYVGRKQLAIQQKQTELQELQANTQFLAFKADLFDRRFTAYDSIARFVSAVVSYAEEPRNDIESTFLRAWGEAKFLFCAETVAGIEEIWEKTCAFGALSKDMKHSFAMHGHYGEGNPERERIALVWLSTRLQTLPDLFPELKLGSSPLSPQP